MKISKIAKLCKDSKLVTMTSTEGGLWIGDGHAVYLLPEFAYLDQNGIALAFGFAEKDKSKIHFTSTPLESFNLEDIDKTETPCEALNFLFSTERGTVRPYRTQEGVLFLYTDYLAPLRDEFENLEIYLRHTTVGEPYFVGKIGMELYALFTPAEIINQSYIERLEEFNALCRVSYQNACAEQKQDYEQTALGDNT